MFKRLFLSLCLIPFLLVSGFPASAFADDLSEGLELYRAKKYKEAIPYLERAANNGHEKAIEALDQIYEKENKTSANGMKPADKASADGEAAKDGQGKSKDQIDAKTNDGKDTVSVPENSGNSKASFWRKVFAIFLALGLVIIWLIHRTILRRKRDQNKEQNPFQ